MSGRLTLLLFQSAHVDFRQRDLESNGKEVWEICELFTPFCSQSCRISASLVRILAYGRTQERVVRVPFCKEKRPAYFWS
ncbi:DNA gyrase inhibitor YacG [Clarias magur]|uniref:DNA gyrase inhibitor YacG n=1 Tax=Clarias magur TaxID=1594786 RepID=A0A8J4TBI4_CLAMG|nr:DNA gyrase inhibitor YacG [Clarias magur]